MVAVLSEHQLKRVAKHEYSVNNSTLIDPYLQRWWCWVVKKLPLWIAPNTITVIGLIVNLFTTLVLVYFSPQARSEVPSWSLHLNGLGLFVYQTLDAVDGKQARRTDSSSPLGELFDHGCDALSMSIVVTGASVALKLGQLPDWMMAATVGAAIMFYITHWVAYVTGTVKFGKIDVTEVQFLGILVFFISGAFGQRTFLELAPIINVELRFVFLYGCLIASLIHIALELHNILQGGVGKNGSSVADTSVLSPAVPMGITLYLSYYNFTYSNVNVFARAPCLFSFAFGIVLAKISILLLVASMSKSPVPMLDIVMLCPVFQCINIHLSSPMSEYRLLWFCMIFSTFNLTHYCHAVISEICEHLNISCFRITAKQNVNEVSATKEVKLD